ncbi:hypothetical protein C8J57DRAFT_1238795 [Mycena rebaudengoi]|nr:hypothetical protein C8J57DRAFT_1238795 [Mycena rebaudengoi]
MAEGAEIPVKTAIKTMQEFQAQVAKIKVPETFLRHLALTQKYFWDFDFCHLCLKLPHLRAWQYDLSRPSSWRRTVIYKLLCLEGGFDISAQHSAQLGSVIPYLVPYMVVNVLEVATIVGDDELDDAVATGCTVIVTVRYIPFSCNDDSKPSVKRGRGAVTIISDDDDMGNEQSSSIHPSSPCVLKQTLAPGVQVPSTSDIDLVQNRQATLAGMGWQSWASGAKEACQMQMNMEHREGMVTEKRREEEKEEEKKEQKRQLAAERQRRHRERKKADREDELSDDDNANTVPY